MFTSVRTRTVHVPAVRAGAEPVRQTAPVGPPLEVGNDCVIAPPDTGVHTTSAPLVSIPCASMLNWPPDVTELMGVPVQALNTELRIGATGVDEMVIGKALVVGVPPGPLMTTVAGPDANPGLSRVVHLVELAPTRDW